MSKAPIVTNNPIALAVKAGLATALALLLCSVLGVPDGVSATLVAVICTSPTVLTGLLRARAQALASLLGGAVAAALALTGLPTLVGLPLAVALTVLLVLPLGLGQGMTVAAFTAIYIFLLPKGDPQDTLLVRMAAVMIGAGSAMVVTVAVSALSYRAIFRRRLARAAEAVATHLDLLADDAPSDALLPLFGPLGELTSELASAERELLLRHARGDSAQIVHLRQAARNLGRIAHFARDLGLAVEVANSALRDEDRVVLRTVAARLRGHRGATATPFGEIGERLLRASARYDEAMAAFNRPPRSAG
jgi:uncharacterized membrane protein YccC